ncbi:MAG TPA: 16S rRNA (cytidine(1402)-2'-O)-methyltransferase [Lachnospiraceae bacterium]|nr:16S rRNA (cytidine(1402)-2'-O)-methyltransferase [Lachnospiraceae bacterium]
MTGKLFLVATPIGNLEDMPPRAVRILKEADVIAAEDTRNSIKLLNHFDIHVSMTSYHEYNKYDKGKYLVDRMLRGETVALITDAGTPGISDPGEVVVQMAAEAGIEVFSVPGPAAFVSALIISGMPTGSFVFEAFLSRETKVRRQALERLKDETRTMILYEAPHHLVKTLEDLKAVLGGDRRIAICKELTKKHEKVLRTTISEAAALYAEEKPRGEYVLVIHGKTEEELRRESEEKWTQYSVKDHVQHYIDQGRDKKTAMKLAAADRGCSRRDIYQALLQDTGKGIEQR